MKLVVAVVRDEYAGQLADNLTRDGFSATKLASTGGFLKAGNSTFLIGVEADRLAGVLDVIQQSCPKKKTVSGDLTFAEGALLAAGTNPAGPLPREVSVGGATVFILSVDQVVKV